MGTDEDKPSPAVMVEVVLQGLRGSPAEDVCARNRVDPEVYAHWNELFLAGGLAALTHAGHDHKLGLPASLHLSHLAEAARAPQIPAWLRKTRGEARAPVVLAIIVAIILQALLPDRLAIRPAWLLPALEGAALLGLSIVNPVRMTRSHPVARATGLGLCGLIVAANSFSGVRLVHAILSGHGAKDPTALFGSGAAIYLTNVVGFALLYWEFDRGGPVARANAEDPHPDFLFPQMTTPELTHPDWEPTFNDYLYVSFTNATAFSPTDTMPLTLWAKGLMGVQSITALAVVGLVVARAVNIL